MNRSVLWFLWHDLRGSRATRRPWTLGYHALPSSWCSLLRGWESIIGKVLTNTNRSKLRGNQRTVAKLVIRRNWSPVEEAVRTTRLELRGRRGRRGGASAHGRLREELRDDWRTLNTNGRFNAGLQAYLDNGRVLREGACWFGGLAHSQILDIAASEDDVLKDIISS